MSARPGWLTIPRVTEWSRPNGLPMTSTHSAMSTRSESPSGMVESGRSASTLSSATSDSASAPITFAARRLPPPRSTSIEAAPSTTWAFVTTQPSRWITNPEPIPRRGPSLSLSKRSRSASSFAPGGAAAVVMTPTTAGSALSARWERSGSPETVGGGSGACDSEKSGFCEAAFCASGPARDSVATMRAPHPAMSASAPAARGLPNKVGPPGKQAQEGKRGDPLTAGDRGGDHCPPRATLESGRALALLVDPFGEDALDRSPVRVGMGLGRACRARGLLVRLRLLPGLRARRADGLGPAALEEVRGAGCGVPALRERAAANRDERPYGPERRRGERELQREADHGARGSTGVGGRRVFGRGAVGVGVGSGSRWGRYA